ncbi:MAG: amidohydrolase family protein [Promethearchaeota archaeon]
MLIVRALEDIPDQGISKGDEFRFYIVDAHHHMGQERSHRNSPPGAYEFYAQLWFELRRMAKSWMDKDRLLFEPYEVRPPDFPSRLFSSRSNWTRLNHGWLVDKTIVFPYSDDYSKSESPDIPSFQVSNDRIAGWTTRVPHSARLIGFGRVDPKDALKGDSNLPLKELDRAVNELGLRGLKLHPLAQLFVDEIEEDFTRKIVQRAAELRVPVIFDTRNIKTVERIKALVDSIRDDSKSTSAMEGLAVIIAHCGMSPGDPKLYEALRDPCIFGETSTLHGKDVPVLFKMAKERIGVHDPHWSENLLFGTDFSFLSVQAAEIILHMFSREHQGTLADIQRILGGNALTLTRKPYSTSKGRSRPPKRVAVSTSTKGNLTKLEEHILCLINEKNWNMASLDFMIPPKHTWPEPTSLSSDGHNGIYFNSYIVALNSREENREIHLWIQKRLDETISCAVLGTKGELSLKTIELATQSLGQKLPQILSKSEVVLKSPDSLMDAVSRLVAFDG